jgi:hypothetical protein
MTEAYYPAHASLPADHLIVTHPRPRTVLEAMVSELKANLAGIRKTP